MKQKTIGLIILFGGAVIVILALTADIIGIGDNPATLEMGWKQIVGVGVGLVVLIAGIWYMLKK